MRRAAWRRWASVLALGLGLALAGCGGAASPAAQPGAGSGTVASGGAAPPASRSAAASSSASAAPSATSVSSSASLVPGAWLHISPPSGAPGTVVTVTGHLPGLPAANPSQPAWESGSICWDGCRGGLRLNPTWHWSTQRHGMFSTTFTVPAVPWLTAAGPHAPSSGNYAVGIRCLGPVVPGCALRGPQAVASFRLIAPAPTLCAAGQACARLALDPAAAAPGSRVKVSGWAPLTQIFGSSPSGYSLVLSPGSQTVGQVSQSASGDLAGTFTVPPSLGGSPLQPGVHTLSLQYYFGRGIRIDLAPTPLPVQAAPSWSSLGAVRPLWIRASRALSGSLLAGSSLTGGTVAVCPAGGGIQWSADGGSPWSDVPTAGAIPVASPSPYVFQPGDSGAPCASALPDPVHTGTFYVTFDLVHASCGCAPPYIPVGYLTADGGKTWRPVPPPKGFTAGDFGGFQVHGRAVQAVFVGGARQAQAGTAAALAVQQTTDGGRTWHAAALGCPASGPCVRWGPRPTSVNACMSRWMRGVLGSNDGGRTWSTRTAADTCQGTVELAATGPASLLLISGGAAFPVEASGDAGETWRALGLPTLPAPAGTQPPGRYPGLRLLPTGALAAPDGTTLQLLPPGASAWCPAAGVSVPQGASGFAVIGGRFWWTLTPARSTGGTDVTNPGGVPLAGLHCAG